MMLAGRAFAQSEPAPIAAEAAPPPKIVQPPYWMKKPTWDDLRNLYPERARMHYISGRAVIQCVVEKTGELKDCKVILETPPYAGFGGATLRAARYYRMRPTNPDGSSIEGTVVKVPIDWMVPS